MIGCMFGILLMTVSTFLEEAGTSIGKMELRKRVETPFTYGVLTSLAGFVVLAISAMVRWEVQAFQWASVPTLALRTVLEIILAMTVIYAIKRADRSTFGFLRTLTIPVLLVLDVLMMYRVDTFQMIGMMLVVLALFLLFMNHGFSRKGAWLTVGGAVLAAATASLYKYNITHFNSPEMDQLVPHAALFLFFVVMSVKVERTHPFRLFRKPICLAQAGLIGAGVLVGSLSFLYAAPSVLMTVKRAVAIFASIIAGRALFHEKHLLLKVGAGALAVSGFLLLLL
jgi:hypothetical protein